MVPYAPVGMPRRTRPPSPFLAFLLGGATTVLMTEWVRFQVGLPLAVLPALTGAMFTGRIVATAFVRRRTWRETHERALVRSRLPRRAPERAASAEDGWTIRSKRVIDAHRSTEVTPPEPVHLTAPAAHEDVARRREGTREHEASLEETR